MKRLGLTLAVVVTFISNSLFFPSSAAAGEMSTSGVSIDRIENGMVVSGFDAWDSLGFREQIGLIKKI